ncbi:MATE family efflux transporter [Dysgonomonas sp. 25]|uniref:MATE family efflux transporter n=1 Tax=Dysgonomonas sp. 25 TaxID=2302933 RepID=UPI0013D41727|nr:MATE family efflux transporter [Dysgonomonas sp. 25]NDV68068.1 MATE family efflux transporter [Dysgonomonas sp. 25]
MNKAILRLAIPNIISNITVPLLGLVDMSVVGHLDDAAYIGAIAVGTTIFNFIYWNFSFLRMGTSGFTAQSFGAEDTREQANILQRSLFVAFIGGLFIIALQSLILQLGFYIFPTGNTTHSYVSDYFRIYVWAAPAVLGMYAFNGWFVGMQDAKTPMFIAIGINIINIALCLFFVFVLKMNIEGVALASLCAQYTGIVTAAFIWLHKYGYMKQLLHWSVLKDVRSYIPFFKVNSNIFIRTLALVFVTTFFVSASTREGDDILAVNALIMQLFTFFSYMMDGFAYSAEALTGRFVGARTKELLGKLIKNLFAWGIGIVALFTIAYALFFEQILSIITDKKDIVALAMDYRLWALLIPITGFSAFLWDGIFVGATASRQMRNSMLVAATTFFLLYFGCKFLLPDFFDAYANNVLWTAFLTYLGIRGIMQAFMAPSVLRKS